jgi:hypothetical protein
LHKGVRQLFLAIQQVKLAILSFYFLMAFFLLRGYVHGVFLAIPSLFFGHPL